MNISGQLLIGWRDVSPSGERFYAVNPANGQKLEPAFTSALASDVDLACGLAAAAFDVYRATSAETRATFLERVAGGIEALQASLIERAVLETALPRTRLEGERARTCAQLRMFARVLRTGLWRNVALDSGQAERQPAPRADLRLHQIALGPVAVFGASNFPLAFSVAGGDTASALAAGCPVIAKAHPAHPGTSEFVARVVRDAARECGLPEGVFSMVGGQGHEVGKSLVAHPAIQAVGFTGSRGGGLALLQIAQSRRQPIPVYAEMSSINPMFLLPGALAARAQQISLDFVESLVLGVGQFCTNPGLVVGVAGTDWNRFIEGVTGAVKAKNAGALLTEAIHRAYCDGTAQLSMMPNVRLVAQGNSASSDGYYARVMVHETSAANWLATPDLENEIFGPSALLVRCDDMQQLHAIAEHLSGQLTVTLQLQEDQALDLETSARLMPVLERKAGRIVANGYPTGVEVGYAIVHGGPFPATSDSRSTSVGASAIARFLRPVCYQNVPDSLLPVDLRRAQVDTEWRLLDGTLTAPTARQK